MRKEKLLIIALACTPLPSLAAMGSGGSSASQSVTIDSLQWTLVDSTSTATLTRYNKKGDTAIIPEKIEYGGKTYQVVEIANNSSSVFYNTHDNIKHASLPKSLKILGSRAFFDCINLEEINLPESLDSIGMYALSNCSNVKSVTLPSHVKGIHYAAFGNASALSTLYCEAPTPPYVSGDSPFYYANSLFIIYVPEGSGSAYRNAAVWNNYVIAQGKGISVSVDLPHAGGLGAEILKQTEDLGDVNYLKIKGSLNDDDIYSIQNRMPNLMEIDLSETDMTELPQNMFYGRSALTKIVLPAHLVKIGEYAFYRCSRLESITIPASVTSMGEFAFSGCTALESILLPAGITSVPKYCFYQDTGLRKVVLPEKLANIGNYAFYNCKSLEHINLGNYLTSISYYAFGECSSLESVELPHSLVELEDQAFGYCTKLTKITLPETLLMVYAPFGGCTNLTEVTCLAIQPPKGNNNNLFSSGDLTGKTLYVPGISIDSYKQTPGWDNFKDIQPLDYLPGLLNVTRDFALNVPADLAETYKPDVTITHWYNNSAGHLDIKGSDILGIGTFNISYDNHYGWWSSESKDNTHRGTLISDAKVQADHVAIDLYVAKNRWQFISFPFDVKVSDIKCISGDTQWVIRRYDGEARANGESGNTWQTMKGDSTLHAHEGYILQCTNAESSSIPAHFQFPALDNASKNNIFAASSEAVAMREYPSEFAHNRSWNLLGNPYPAFFDTRFFDYASPFTVWNRSNQTYQAYSPVDDSYILAPSEAFFVQKPADQAAITFSAEGRQHDLEARTIQEPGIDEAAARGGKAKASIHAEREVYNLSLSSSNGTDRTRFVINPQAEMSYNALHDAGKMISETTLTPQLYTIGDNDGIDYAINERPMGNGIVRLGAIFAEPGTYTLTLAGDKTAILIDQQEGKQVELDANGYTFTTKAGEMRDRFLVKVTRGTTGIERTDIVDELPAADSTIYTLDGRKVSGKKMKAGTYIMKSGKKTRKVNMY